MQKPEMALLSSAFPANPRPFALRIDELCENDSGAIRSDEAKACLVILVQMAYGQLDSLDTHEEARRLMDVLEES